MTQGCGVRGTAATKLTLTNRRLAVTARRNCRKISAEGLLFVTMPAERLASGETAL